MSSRNPKVLLLSPSDLSAAIRPWAEQMADIIRKSGGEVELKNWSGSDPGEESLQKDFILILITEELMVALEGAEDKIQWFEKRLKARKMHQDQILRLILSGRQRLKGFPGQFGSLSALPMESLLEPSEAVEIILKELNQRIRILGKKGQGSAQKEKKGFASALKGILGGNRSKVEWEKIRPFVISTPNTLKMGNFGKPKNERPFDLT
ncbi:MAG: hypothetical protein H6581_02220 [Bacteroidia bacterium]|nr:hypothetical protein [Bacteroidia bacterium]